MVFIVLAIVVSIIGVMPSRLLFCLANAIIDGKSLDSFFGKNDGVNMSNHLSNCASRI